MCSWKILQLQIFRILWNCAIGSMSLGLSKQALHHKLVFLFFRSVETRICTYIKMLPKFCSCVLPLLQKIVHMAHVGIKNHLGVQRKILGIFFEKIYNFFRTSSAKFQDFEWKFFDRVVKTAFYMSGRRFEWVIFFRKLRNWRIRNWQITEKSLHTVGMIFLS